MARSVVRFRTADGEFAISVENVREVRTTAGMQHFPTPGPHVIGFLADGDRSITVVATLGAGRDQILVLDPGGKPFGLLVEEVAGVTRLDDAEIGPPPVGQTGTLVCGVLRARDGVALLVDARALGRTLAGWRDPSA